MGNDIFGDSLVITKAVEEEYWAIQYIPGYGDTFIPYGGSGAYNSYNDAEEAAQRLAKLESHRAMRVLHITRRIEYSTTLDLESNRD